MKVLVLQEFYEDNGHVRHWPGQILTVDLEFYELYRPFLREIKARKEVTK